MLNSMKPVNWDIEALRALMCTTYAKRVKTDESDSRIESDLGRMSESSFLSEKVPIGYIIGSKIVLFREKSDMSDLRKSEGGCARADSSP
jgi:hypothetical protein